MIVNSNLTGITMASNKEYIDFVLDQCNGLSARAMMGEFVLYYGGKVVGGVYNNHLLVKPIPSAKALIPNAGYQLPYTKFVEKTKMSKAYDFLKECGAFFVLTINGDCPAGRPFGAVMEDGEYLYLSTNDLNEAHKQIRMNGKIQIVAKKPDSREWIRITGVATECDEKALKDKMLEECPILKQRFGAVGYEHYILLRVSVENVELK